MAATVKGAISFGLLHVPVSLHTATQDNDIRFNQLCREDGGRVKYKKVCAKCGKEVSAQDIPQEIALPLSACAARFVPVPHTNRGFVGESSN